MTIQPRWRMMQHLPRKKTGRRTNKISIAVEKSQLPFSEKKRKKKMPSSNDVRTLYTSAISPNMPYCFPRGDLPPQGAATCRIPPQCAALLFYAGQATCTPPARLPPLRMAPR